MASLHLQPPSIFNFHTPDEWPHWKKRFEQFCLVSGLSDKGQEKQVLMLLYCIGEDANDTLTSTNICCTVLVRMPTIPSRLRTSPQTSARGTRTLSTSSMNSSRSNGFRRKENRTNSSSPVSTTSWSHVTTETSRMR